jgi:hypothetical protein
VKYIMERPFDLRDSVEGRLPWNAFEPGLQEDSG